MGPKLDFWRELLPQEKWMPLFLEPPYFSDLELDYGCTYIATYILKKTWGKLRDKRRPWKITRDSIVHDLAEDGKEMALRAIRMGYYWHLSCSEKDHLHYITRTLQCNKILYSFLRVFRIFLTFQAFGKKELRMSVEIAFRIDSTTLIPSFISIKNRDNQRSS